MIKYSYHTADVVWRRLKYIRPIRFTPHVRNIMFAKLSAAADSVGKPYIVMMIWCIVTVGANLVGANRSFTSLPTTFFNTTLVMMGVFLMWQRSISPHRTLVTLLMIGDTMLSSTLLITTGNSYVYAMQFIIDIFWIVGICVLYTGPRLLTVVRNFRRPTA